MVFSNRFFNWIIECISTTCHLILVNGPSSKVCYAKRGLKQGDSLSSFLFTFAMEHLSLSLQSRVETGYLKTFKLGGNLVESLTLSTLSTWQYSTKLQRSQLGLLWTTLRVLNVALAFFSIKQNPIFSLSRSCTNQASLNRQTSFQKGVLHNKLVHRLLLSPLEPSLL